MQRPEKNEYKELRSENNLEITLVEFQESVFIDDTQRGVEFSFNNDLQITLTPEELRNASEFLLSSNGFGGTCDQCGSTCEDSVFLDVEFDFVTFHPECYKHIQEQFAIYYNMYKSDIVSFSL